MSKPLEGVRVLEVAAWTFVPAAGAAKTARRQKTQVTQFLRAGDVGRACRQPRGELSFVQSHHTLVPRLGFAPTAA